MIITTVGSFLTAPTNLGTTDIVAGCWCYNNLIFDGFYEDDKTPRTSAVYSRVGNIDWVVSCGKNGVDAGATHTLPGVVSKTGAVGTGETGTIINGVVTSTTGG